MSDYSGIHELAREKKCVVVVFTIEDVEDVIRLSANDIGMEGWTREKMWWFLEEQRGTLPELLADKGLEILERELTVWSGKETPHDPA